MPVTGRVVFGHMDEVVFGMPAAGAVAAQAERLGARRIFLMVSNSLAAARDLAVVSNKANSLSTISLPDLVKVSKAQTNRWPDGKPITLILRAPSTPEMKRFWRRSTNSRKRG